VFWFVVTFCHHLRVFVSSEKESSVKVFFFGVLWNGLEHCDILFGMLLTVWFWRETEKSVKEIWFYAFINDIAKWNHRNGFSNHNHHLLFPNSFIIILSSGVMTFIITFQKSLLILVKLIFQNPNFYGENHNISFSNTFFYPS